MVDGDGNVPGGNEPAADGVEGKSPKQSVSHETYQRTVDAEKKLKQQNKELADKIAAREAQDKEAEEKRLLANQEHEKVIAQQKAEIERLTKEGETRKEQVEISRKLNSAVGLLSASGVQLDSRYFQLLDLDKITLDADGKPDANSVAKVVADFKRDNPLLVQGRKADLPGNSTGGSGQPLTLDAWKKLPYDQKMKRYGDVKQ